MASLGLLEGLCVFRGDDADLGEGGVYQCFDGLPLVVKLDVDEGHGNGVFDFAQ